jgi:hypothetical protein
MAVENQMDQGAAAPPQAEEKAERGATHAGKSGERSPLGRGRNDR